MELIQLPGVRGPTVTRLHANRLEGQVFTRTLYLMTRSQFLATIRRAERESQSYAKALGSLRMIVEGILAINGDGEGNGCDEEFTRHLESLVSAPKPRLREWAAVCSHDPLLAHLIKARKSYARTNLTREKGVRKLEVAILMTYRSAVEIGFKGSPNQWEDLLRMRG